MISRVIATNIGDVFLKHSVLYFYDMLNVCRLTNITVHDLSQYVILQITVQILDEARGILYIIRISARDYFVLSQCSRLTAN